MKSALAMRELLEDHLDLSDLSAFCAIVRIRSSLIFRCNNDTPTS